MWKGCKGEAVCWGQAGALRPAEFCTSLMTRDRTREGTLGHAWSTTGPLLSGRATGQAMGPALRVRGSHRTPGLPAIRLSVKAQRSQLQEPGDQCGERAPQAGLQGGCGCGPVTGAVNPEPQESALSGLGS